jgi:hypothetical protein
MESKRKDYINKILSDIHNIENSINADNNMLDSIKNQGDTPFVMAQIDKVEIRNNMKIINIENLNIRLKHINMGHLDNDFVSEINQDKIDQDTHNSYIINKRLEKSKIKQAKSKISQDFYKKTAQGDREKKWAVKNIEKSYQHFLRTNDSIPHYILRNLENMPNNKGYIWKGIICLGELPEETKYPLTLFERQKGLLIIHEWTYYEYKIFHKKDKDKKILFSVQTRKVIQDSTIEKSWIELSLPPEPLPIPQKNQDIPRLKHIQQHETRNENKKYQQQRPSQQGSPRQVVKQHSTIQGSKQQGPSQQGSPRQVVKQHSTIQGSKQHGRTQYRPQQQGSPRHGVKQHGHKQQGSPRQGHT